jgi:hypothetical protein
VANSEETETETEATISPREADTTIAENSEEIEIMKAEVVVVMGLVTDLLNLLQPATTQMKAKSKRSNSTQTSSE